MGVVKKDYGFTNCIVDLEDEIIYEYDKYDELLDTYSLREILDEIGSLGKVNLTIKFSNVMSTKPQD